MKNPAVNRIILGFSLFLILIPQLLVAHFISGQTKQIATQIQLEKERILDLVQLKKTNQSVSKKIDSLKKSHAAELLSLQDNALESLFYASHLARQHQLIFLKSSSMANQSISLSLSGSLTHFLAFLKDFTSSEKALHLSSLSISAKDSLALDLTWEIPKIESPKH